MKIGEKVFASRGDNKYAKGTIVKRKLFGKFVVEHSVDFAQHRDYLEVGIKYNGEKLHKELPKDGEEVKLCSDDLNLIGKGFAGSGFFGERIY